MSTEYRSLQQVLNSIIKQQKLAEVIERNELIEKFEEVAGHQIAQQAKVKSFEKGILILEVESSAWRNEIFLLSSRIVEKINQSLGRELVKKIIIL